MRSGIDVGESGYSGDALSERGVVLPMVLPLSTSNACKKRETSAERDRPSHM